MGGREGTKKFACLPPPQFNFAQFQTPPPLLSPSYAHYTFGVYTHGGGLEFCPCLSIHCALLGQIKLLFYPPPLLQRAREIDESRSVLRRSPLLLRRHLMKMLRKSAKFASFVSGPFSQKWAPIIFNFRCFYFFTWAQVGDFRTYHSPPQHHLKQKKRLNPLSPGGWWRGEGFDSSVVEEEEGFKEEEEIKFPLSSESNFGSKNTLPSLVCCNFKSSPFKPPFFPTYEKFQGKELLQ